MQRAEYSANEKKKTNIKERKSIKDEERYKIIELHASGKDHARSRRSGDNVSKYRESKKPRELKRAIGKIDSDDWKIKNIEEKLVINTQGMHRLFLMISKHILTANFFESGPMPTP